MKYKIDTTKSVVDLEDLFGIFFEDLNHAADGGLYAEMVRNRSFEFSPIDNKEYTPLTAWAPVAEHGSVTLQVREGGPFEAAPHYLEMTRSEDGVAAVENLGFGPGMYIEAGKKYLFSMYVKGDVTLRVSLVEGALSQLDFAPEGHTLVAATEEFCIDETGEPLSANEWKKVSAVFTAGHTLHHGRLRITMEEGDQVCLDFVSLFPEDTYGHRVNGLRKDLVELLKDLHPKFVRFPGGCLVHDGSLNAEDRDSLYRWKNTIGPVTGRPPRRSNWNYNQTLGLGYYEYFLLCEDLDAKPIPVLPGAYDPHHQRKVPLDQLQPWVEEALDLIQFANGDENSKWGKIRCELGHPQPFGLEYIAIGNEEVGEGFTERYPYFHKAIREKYPEIKIINSSGPFCAGGEYERGWESARTWKSDLVDEHYYASPQWFLSNVHRYDHFSKEDPKVFLGEYATWGNTYENALVEAAYMTGLQNAAHAVSLACYAPLFCNVDYVNWQPDMIWFNNEKAIVTPNYLVQKLFMNHQGKQLLSCMPEEAAEPIALVDERYRLSGQITLASVDNTVLYSQIKVVDHAEEKTYSFFDGTMTKELDKYFLMGISAKDYTIDFHAKELTGTKGFRIYFAQKDSDNYMLLELGGWQNMDGAINEVTDGRSACLTQSEFIVEPERDYHIEVQVRDHHVGIYVDGELFQETTLLPIVAEPLYVTASEDENIILKVVNVLENPQEFTASLEGLSAGSHKVTLEYLAGYESQDENTFEDPNHIQISTEEFSFSGTEFTYEIPPKSVLVFVIEK